MAFNPKEHLIQMSGKNGQTSDYLEVKWRLVWLREDHPTWGIETELLQYDVFAILKAAVKDETGRVIATGHGMAKTGGSAKWAGREIEKAETAAIGRALAHAGIGTQFIDDETEGEGDHDHIADSPVERKGNAQPKNATPKTQQQPASPTASDSNNPLDRGFSVETGNNFLGWAKRNYGLSDENARKTIDAIAGRELDSLTKFSGTIYDAIAGVMLVAAQDNNVPLATVLADIKAGKLKVLAPTGKPFTAADIDAIANSAAKLATIE